MNPEIAVEAAKVVTDPTMMQQAWDYVVTFCSSPAFYVATGVFLLYLLIFRLGRWVKDLFAGLFSAIFYLIQPNRWRRVFFNMFSLVCMVGGVASASAAHARLTDGNVTMEAILGGGVMLGVWGLVMLISNQVERYVAPRKTKSPKRSKETVKSGK